MPAISKQHAVLTIAGSDPSGGAGIQADLKTFTALGVYGAAAITCLTAQNTLGVASFQAVDPAFVAKQIDLVISDLPVSHIKTGMIGTGEIAQAIGKSLEGFMGEIICDPVLAASDGHTLLAPQDLDIYCSHLLSCATVITPNVPELELLSQINCQDDAAIDNGVEILLNNFPQLRAVIVTGGHRQERLNTVTNFLYLRTAGGSAEKIHSSHPRTKTTSSHGTGCTFASAFTALHLLSGNDREAFLGAANFVAELVAASISHPMGAGKGPLMHHMLRKD
jgi:hydroxymethylpyrimidine/phosphomethylpyrimidine kinase